MIEEKVRWADLDPFGHVNNNVYLSYFEQSRIAYLKDKLDINDKLEIDPLLPVVAEISCRYIKPLKIDQIIKIETKIEKFSRIGIDFTHTIYNQHLDSIIAKGLSKIVFMCPLNEKIAKISVDTFNRIKLVEQKS